MCMRMRMTAAEEGDMEEGARESVGSAIARKRHALGISQRELAKAAHVNNATIARLEKDPGATADPATLRAVASKLGIDYNCLLALNGTIDDDPAVRVIARASARMDGAEREAMLALLRRKFRLAFAGTESDGV